MNQTKIYNWQSRFLYLITCVVSVFIWTAETFEFRSLSISTTPLIINQLATYKITMVRQLSAEGISTPWDSQIVSAGSKVKVTFPSEFTLTGTQTCSYILINSSPVFPATCTVLTGSNAIQFSDAITSDTYISNVIMEIKDVKNPSLALQSSPFVGEIGTDISASDSIATVTYEPDQLQSLSLTFTPNIVSSEGSLMVTFTPKNTIPAGGSVQVKFPDNLLWTRQVLADKLLPIEQSMSCSAIQNVQFLISCSGSTGDATVLATNMFDTDIAPSTKITFTINQLFVPPTTQPIDQLTITTFSSSPSDLPSYRIDKLTATIDNLAPLDITSKLELTTTSPPIINTNIGLKFSFTLMSTISKDDYFIIKFPENTEVNYLAYFSLQLTLNTFTYDDSTWELKFYQASSAASIEVGTSVSFTFLEYKTSSSVQNSPPITLSIYNNGYLKMQGTTSLTTLPKQYSSTVSTANSLINVQTSYTISFKLNDPLSPTGYFVVFIPSQLTLGGVFSVSIIGTSISSSPSTGLNIESDNTVSITLTGLNTQSSDIPVQDLSIAITGLTQPSSSKDISPFSVKIFYSNNDDLVAEAKNTNKITTTPGTLQGISIAMSSLQNLASPSEYTLSIPLTNTIAENGYISVTFPIQIAFTNDGVCKLNGNTLTSDKCEISSQTIKFTTTNVLSKQSIVTVSYSKFKNPISTKTIPIQNIFTANSLSQNIDLHTTDSAKWPKIQTTDPSPLTSPSLLRGNKQNGRESVYQISFTQNQAIIEAQTAIKIIFPTPITIVENEIVCSYQSTIYPCTYTSDAQQYIKIIIPATNQNDKQYKVTITNGVYNPISMKPTESISIETLGVDGVNQYKYSKIDSGLVVENTFASDFADLSFQFDNRVLSSNTKLTLNFDFSTQKSEIANTDYLVLVPASSFAVTVDSSLSCSSTTQNFSPICTVQQNPTTNKVQLKIASATGFPQEASTILFQSFLTPQFIPNDFTTLQSYTETDDLISSSTNLIKFQTFCTFPCKTCDEAAPEVCLSCYEQSLTTKIYLHEGTCLVSCPSQYYEDTGNFICDKCLEPCFQCDKTSTNCVYCNMQTQYKYLFNTKTDPSTGTCLSKCPDQMYPDITKIPNICTDCVSPCLLCSDVDICLSCVDNHYLYKEDCLLSCPADITVAVTNALDGIDKCQDCDPTCKTCLDVFDKCTSCEQPKALHEGKCVSECPGDKKMVIQQGLCVSCIDKCLTCQTTKQRCLTCDFQNSVNKYFYGFDCLEQCPDFYYPDSFGVCFSCADLAGRFCKNCESPTVCITCDTGYVLFDSNCLDKAPDGYLDINGKAVPCENDCETCSVTLTNCTSCKTLNLFGNTCQENCPQSTIPLNQICQQCQSPCLTCQTLTTKCLSCQQAASPEPPTFLSNFACVKAEDCPPNTYPNETQRVCVECSSPCLDCTSDQECLSCLAGFFFIQQSKSCEETCPSGYVGINRLCKQCTSPCSQCAETTTKCTKCINDLFFNKLTSQCLLQCPVDISISNPALMQCQGCKSPCKTCENSVDHCKTCIVSLYFFENSCYQTCPDGYYGSNRICNLCENNCETCTSTTKCKSCPNNFYFYDESCLTQCPDSHAYLPDSGNICTNCSEIVVGCSNCTKTGQCYSCYEPYKYLESQCLDQCPSGYKYEIQVLSCVIKNQTDVSLQENLNNENIFPVPFTVLAGVFIIASCMSKLQNQHTYLIGLIYSLLGLVETGAIGYLIFRYWELGSDNQYYQWDTLLLLLVTAGIIYFLNIISFLIQTPLLIIDSHFQQWLSSPKGNNKFAFTVVLIISVLINYKFKMMTFTRLFKFFCLSAFLSSVTKFRIFNVFSFFGMIAEGLGLYVCFVTLLGASQKLKQTATETADEAPTLNFSNNLLLQYAFLDVIIVLLLNIILAILVTWKKDSFFEEEQDDGYILQKKMNIEGEDYSKQALQGQLMDQKFIPEGQYNSYGVLANAVIDEDSLQQSLTQSQIHQSRNKSKIKVYFADNQQGQSSNPFRIEPNNDNDEKNIFSGLSEQDQYRLSEHEPSNYEQMDVSHVGGSQKFVTVNSPRRILSPKKAKEVAVVKTGRVSNMATDNQNKDDIRQQISQREIQLDELRKQMEQQEKIRKQKRKSHKKLKKTIQIADSPSQEQPEVSYQQISIKQTCSIQQNTEQDTKKFSTLKNSEQIDSRPILMQQQAQGTVDDILPPNQDQQYLDNWMQVRIQDENRKQLPVFTEINKQMKTVSRSNDNDDNYYFQQANGNQNSEQQEQHPQLQVQSKQETIGQDINFMKQQQSIRNHQFQQSREIDDGTLEDGQVIFDQYIDQGLQSPRKQLSIEYEENLSKQVVTEPTKKNRNQDGHYRFEEQQGNYDNRQGNTKMNFYNAMKDKEEQQNQGRPQQQDEDQQQQKAKKEKHEDQQDEGISLQDSNRQENQRINQRPISAAIKPNLHNNQALLQILQQAQRDKLKIRKGQNKRKLPQQQGISPADKMFNYKPTNEDLESDHEKPTQKSKVYLAGLRQIEMESLKKKTLMNSRRISQEDNSDLQSNKHSGLNDSRNRSYNNVPFRKYTSKDVSADDMSFSNLQPFQSNYEEMMNPRNESRQKPGTSGGQRRQMPSSINSNRQLSNPHKIRVNTSQYNNEDSLKKYYNYNLSKQKYRMQDDTDQLQQYYSKQKALKSRSKQRPKNYSKQKQMIRQRSLEDTKRYKQLQKIYAPPNKMK